MKEWEEVLYLASEDVDRDGEGDLAAVVNAFQPELCSGEVTGLQYNQESSQS